MVIQVDKVPNRNEQQDEGQTKREEFINEGVVADEDFWRQEQKLIGEKARTGGAGAKGDWKGNEVELPRISSGSENSGNFEENWLRENHEKSQSIVVHRESNDNASDTDCSEVKDENEKNEGNPYELNGHLELAGEEEDEEEYGDTEEETENANGWIRKKVVTSQVQQHDAQFNDNNGHAIQQAMPNLNKTAIGEVNVVNSRHVNFGDRNFYKGPVTIKQFVYTNSCPIQDKNNDPSNNNNINEAYNGRMSDVEPNEIPRVNKGDQTILHPYGDYDTVTKWMWTWRCAVILCALALISVTIVVVASVILTNRTNTGMAVLPVAPTSGTDPDDIWVNSVRFIERNEWLAQPPNVPLTKLTEVPAPYVIISHTASAPCVLQSECVQRVRRIQTFHMEGNGWNDIGYNFLVGGDGLAYVGRGWDSEGAHAFGWNKKSIGISLIGTFNDVPPYKNQLYAAMKVIELGVNLSKIAPDYKLLGHRQVSTTLSPGDKLYQIIQTWDHWSPDPPPRGRAFSLNRTYNYCLVFLTSLLLSIS